MYAMNARDTSPEFENIYDSWLHNPDILEKH